MVSHRGNHRSLALLLAPAMAIVWLVQFPLPSAAGDCPDPRTCDRFEYTRIVDGKPAIWRPSPDGLTRIPYWINPTQPWISESDAIAAIRAAFSTWEAALPTVRFVYQGTTPRPPIPFDGENVVGWFAPYGPGVAHASTTTIGSYRVEADINLTAAVRWAWYPCEQRNNSCTNLTNHEAGSSQFVHDVQNIVTHEIGHWLNLADLRGPETTQLTMSTHVDDGNKSYVLYRHKVTLGLGDILGARSMYPCGCPLPPIYYP